MLPVGRYGLRLRTVIGAHGSSMAYRVCAPRATTRGPAGPEARTGGTRAALPLPSARDVPNPGGPACGPPPAVIISRTDAQRGQVVSTAPRATCSVLGSPGSRSLCFRGRSAITADRCPYAPLRAGP